MQSIVKLSNTAEIQDVEVPSVAGTVATM